MKGELQDIAERIKRLRGRSGITQEQLAQSLGVTVASLRNWESGRSRPGKSVLGVITEAESRGLDATLNGAGANDGVTDVAGNQADPRIDFSADPEVVRTVAEGERLAYGYLFNPAFAAETSLIDPLPHQRIAVYRHMLTQPRLRFLLADDAGAGKTIMAGLYVREMLARRLIRRILIVPPAGLVGNWQSELRTLFSLTFQIVSGSDARSGNPFIGPDSDLIIVSVDTLAAERAFSRLQDQSVTPYDLVIFDEAHKLSANADPDGRVRKTDRYCLGEALAGAGDPEPRWRLEWHCRHLLLLTATPHMGKDFPYYCLWRLLEPESLPTKTAFDAYPMDARQRHFIRRTKEEMVRFDGSRLYPTRVSDTLGYELSQGEISEQTLYDRTTDYISTYYNQARILNRSAARLAMSVFQRRLASSTYALRRSFERRIERLGALIDDIRSGRLDEEQLRRRQQDLGLRLEDTLEDKTGDEEQTEDGLEENQAADDRAMGGVVARSLAELEVERSKVEELLAVARQVEERGNESKFDRLSEILKDPQWRDEKILIFTEHRDTLDFLVRRFEALGFTGQIAAIHGAMDYLERQEQVEFFRKKVSEGGAHYMVCTDAASEGINLQFCWLMINYDIPWNPARLEQRMGRIHRYKQEHDPVRIINLISNNTRVGKVLKTLLEKLERIRKALKSDKVFDVIGYLFEGVSLKHYLEAVAIDGEDAKEQEGKLEGRLTEEQVHALEERQRRLFGDGGDVKSQLPAEREELEREQLRCLLPGYVLSFIERALPLVGLDLLGDADRIFTIHEAKPGALDPFLPILEAYPEGKRDRFTVHKPKNAYDAIFLYPGEPFFDRLRVMVCSRFSRPALSGAVFIDPYAQHPYMFHLAVVSVIRSGDPAIEQLASGELLEQRLVGLKQYENGEIEQCPVEHLLLLKGSASAAGWAAVPQAVRRFEGMSVGAGERALGYLNETVGAALAESHRERLRQTLAERERFLTSGYDYEEAELLARRKAAADAAITGDAKAQAELGAPKGATESTRLRQRTGAGCASARTGPGSVGRGEVCRPRSGGSFHRPRRPRAPRRGGRDERGAYRHGIRAGAWRGPHP